MDDAEVHAAGGLVVRDDGRLAVIHRPRYDDWSLPKGKLDPGESFEEAALREVREEIGLRCELLEELPPTRYTDEVDEVRWVGRDAAAALLTYERDRALVAGL